MKRFFLVLILINLVTFSHAQKDEKTKEDFEKELYDINLELTELRGKIKKLESRRTVVNVEIRRIETKEKKAKEIAEAQGLSEEEVQVVYDSITNEIIVPEKKFFYFATTEVFNNNYTQSLKFITQQFICPEGTRTKRKEWVNEFLDFVHEKENIWSTYSDIRNSKPDLYYFDTQKAFYKKYNVLKKATDKNQGIRLIQFKPDCYETEKSKVADSTK